MNKRGIFFTLATFVVISLFLASYTLYQSSQETKSTKQRVETMNSFLFSTEEDLRRQIYILTFRTIFLLEDQITTTGSYVSNLDSIFQESLYNGTINGVHQVLLEGATFPEILLSINERANKISVNVTLEDTSFTVTQDDPWNVEARLTVKLTLEDAGDVAKWEKEETIIAEIPIENFEDPLYVVNTNGLVTNQIRKTTYKPFVQSGNTANLSLHALNSYYTESTLAPSFLMRLKGQTTPSPQGIESLVNLNELSSYGVTVREATVVDYLYFTGQSPTSHAIQTMPGWFRLDTSHLTAYNVENLTA